MAHTPSTTQNFLIHDANGKPQVIKVVHTTQGPTKAWRTSQTTTVVPTSTRLFKTPVKQLYLDEEDERLPSNLIIRKKVATIPPRRGPELVQKVIQLSPSEMQAIQTDPSSRLSGSSPPYKRIQMKNTPNSGQQRAEAEFFTDYKKRRRGEKCGKGLRHFSMKVCEKVREKGLTTYNEVADELVAEFTGSPFQPNQEQNYDQKNIRRRVYDALNVLMAMSIISKEKKEIRWLGLPMGYPRLNTPKMKNIDAERNQILERIELKKKTLQGLILQQIAFKSLVERNKAIEAVKGQPNASSCIQLPMLVVSTNQNTTVNCSVSNDRKEYFFSFDDLFEIKDESHVLQGMGMMMGLHTGDAAPEDLIRAKTMIPRALAPYLEEMVHTNVGGESSSGLMSPCKEEFEEGPVYLEEDSDTASETDMDTH